MERVTASEIAYPASYSSCPSWDEIIELADRVISLAVHKDLKLACAESCTGGMISSALTSIAGSSQSFIGGITSYAPSIKHEVLGVPQHIIDDPEIGVVSCACARAMAVGATRLCGADLGVSTTGIAGPTGAEPGKPVGTVYLGLAVRHVDNSFRTEASRHVFSGSRDSVRLCATHAALALLSAELMERR